MKQLLTMLWIVYLGMAVIYAQEKNANECLQTKGMAIIDFEVRGDAPPHTGQAIADMIASVINPQKYHIIERSQLKKVLKERLFQANSVITSRIAKDLFAMGVGYLMLGHIERTENQYYGSYRVIDLETAKREELLRGYIKHAKDYCDFVDKLLLALGEDENRNLIDAVQSLVRRIGLRLKDKQPQTGKYRVGVFAFGDQNGKATAEMGNLPVIIQGELADQLRPFLGRKTPGKFMILDPCQLDVVFTTAAISPLGINPRTLQLAPKILKKVNIDVGIVGRYKTKNPQIAISRLIIIDSYVIISDSKDVYQYSTSVGARQLSHNAGTNNKKPSGRFQMKFFFKTDNRLADSNPHSWQAMNLHVCRNPECKFHNTHFLMLKPEMEGKRYKIHLINNGIPQIDDHPLDKDRLFSAALLIDGVNSFYQAKGKNAAGRTITGPVVVHPLKASKWVLTAPKRILIANKSGMTREISDNRLLYQKTTIKHAALADVQGPGHSRLEITGFQKNANFADAFVFARPRDSIAETVGISDNIGMISAYFYGEKLPSLIPPPPVRSLGGTRAGRQVDSPTFGVEFEIDTEPVEVLRVFYRYEGEMPCPREHLELIK